MKNKQAPVSVSTQLTEAAPSQTNQHRLIRINQRFILFCLGGLVIAGAGVHVVHGIQVDRNAEALKVRSHKALADANVRLAVQSMAQYIQLRPNDLDALAEFGDLINDSSKSVGAQRRVFLTWEQVLRKDGERKDSDQIRTKLIDVAMRLGRWEDALQHIDILKQRIDSSKHNTPEYANLTFKEALCNEEKGNYREAAEGLLLALEQDPTKIESYGQLVISVFKHKEVLPRGDDLTALPISQELKDLFPKSRDEAIVPDETASRILDRMVKHGQPAYRTHLANAAYLRARGKLAEARASLAQAVTLKGDDPEVRKMTTDFALEEALAVRQAGNIPEFQKLLAQARAEAKIGTGLTPRDYSFYLLAAKIEEIAPDYAAGEAQLSTGLKEIKEARKNAKADELVKLSALEFELNWKLIDLLITKASLAVPGPDQALIEQANKRITELRPIAAHPATVDFLDHRVRAAVGDWQGAAARLEKTRQDLTLFADLAQRADILLGECYERLGNPEARMTVFRRALKGNPDWMVGRLQLAEALVSENRLEDAIAEYTALQQVRGVYAKLADLRIRQQLKLPQDRRNWPAVLQLIELVKKTVPDSIDYATLRAKVLAIQGKFNEAQQELETARDQHPKDPAVWTALVELAVTRTDRQLAEQLAEVDKLLENANQQVGKDPLLVVAAANRAILQNPEQARQTLVDLEKQRAQFDAAGKTKILDGLIKITFRIGNSHQAYEFLKIVANEDKHNFEVRQVLAQLASSLKISTDGKEDFEKWLKEIRDIEGTGGPNGNYIAAANMLDAAKVDRKLLDDKQLMAKALEEPRKLLLQTVQARPMWSDVHRALGRLELLADQFEKAFVHYQRAFDLGDRSKEVIYTCTDYYVKHKDEDRASQILAQAATDNPAIMTGDLARLSLRVAWERRQFDNAQKLAQDLADKGDFRDKIRHAQVLFVRYRALPESDKKSPTAQKWLTDARAEFESVVKSSPDQPEAWFSYIYYLVSVKDIAAAETALRDAEQKLPDTPKHIRPLYLARYNDLLDKKAEAEQFFLDAIEAAPDELRIQMGISEFYIRRGQQAKADKYLEKLTDPKTKAPPYIVSWAKVRLALNVAAIGNYNDTTEALARLKKDAEQTKENREARIESLRGQVVLLLKRPTHRDRMELIARFEELDELKALQAADQFLMADIYALADVWDKAQVVIEKLLAEDPLNETYMAWYAKQLLRRSSSDKKYVQKASLLAEKLKQQSPGSFRSIDVEARVMSASGAGHAAAKMVHDYVLGLKTPENDATALANERAIIRASAELCEELRQPEQAEALYNLYVKKTTDDPDVGVVMATFFARQGKVDQALKVCEESQSTWKPAALVVTAVNVVSSGKPTPEQLERANKLVQSVPQSGNDAPRIQIALAGLRAAQGQFAEAETLNRKLLEQNPSSVAVLNNLAFLLAIQNKEINEAEELIGQAIIIAGPLSPLLDTRGFVRLQMGQIESAIEDLTIAGKGGETEIVDFHLAQALVKKGDNELAGKTFRRALQNGLRPSRLHPMELAPYYELTKQFKEGEL